MNKIRVGFIGTGRISDLHAIEYLNNPHAQIVALCDADPALAEARATAWGLDDVRICDDYAELLALDQVDLVDILLPHHLHAEVALAAMAAGKAVSLQKPMTLTLDEADRLVEAAASSQARFRVFENFLFYPPIVKAKALIDEGAIGTPLTIRLKSNSGNREMAWKVPASAQAWRQDRTMAGGGPCVFDDGHHKFAIAWYFMGAAEQVHAWIGQTEMPNGSMRDSPAMISIRFPGNRFGSFEVVHSPELTVLTEHYAQDDRVEITGTAGVVFVNQGHGRLADIAPVALLRDGTLTEYRDIETGWERSFVHCTRHFIDALRSGEPARLSGEDARDVLRFGIAAESSAQQGRAVDV
jgi:predicted dehydrogenase